MPVRAISPDLTDEQRDFAETAIRSAIENFLAQKEAGATDGFLNHDTTTQGWREFLNVNVVSVNWVDNNPFTKADLDRPGKLAELTEMCNDILSEIEATNAA